MDIRRIELYKQFRFVEQKNLTEDHQWQVFGYYDSMNVEEVEMPKAVHNRSEIHPLERIYEDTQEQSFSGSESLKKHVIYAIGAGQKAAYQEFWKRSKEYPLLLVSLVHFKHPMVDTSEPKGSPLQNPMSDLLSEMEACFPCVIDHGSSASHPNLYSSVYMAFDCNDAIIFTFSHSIAHAMQKISEITQTNQDIREIFTIHACNYSILNEDNETLRKAWLNQEPQIKTIHVFMRDKDHGLLIAKTKQFEEEYRKAYASYPALESGQRTANPIQRMIIPGHEDVLLTMEDIPLELFWQMYGKPATDSEGILRGFFITRLCRTVIPAQVSEAPIDPPRQDASAEVPHPDASNDPSRQEASTEASHPDAPIDPFQQNSSSHTPHRAADLVHKLKTAFEIIREKQKPIPIWGGALMELLIELSNIEISLTAYDIYAQAICAQKTMILTICELLGSTDPKIEKEVFFSASELTDNIKHYLNGWSQLSFHAMHAEWQLTQSSDINRLYLFPAKLCRLYSAFMEKSSQILNVKNGNKEHDDCVFFLTPNICNEPHFLSIYRPVALSHVLIHGEIPADFMFSPQVILPTLVHEAAHYSGSKLRNRSVRNNAFKKCVIADLFSYLLDWGLLDRIVPETKAPFLDLLVDKLDQTQFIANHNYHDTDYGDDVIKQVLQIVDHLMQLQPSFVNAVLADVIRKHPNYANKNRLEQLLSIEDFSQDSNKEQRLLWLSDRPNNIGEFSNDLMGIFRESFSDLCMIMLLGLSLEEYLSIICRGIRFDAQSGENKKLKWAQHERFRCVIQSAYPNKDFSRIKQWMKEAEIQKELDNEERNQTISVKDDTSIKQLAEVLCQEEQELNEKNPVFPYMRNQILYYLNTVADDLEESILKKLEVEDLRIVYRSMAINMRDLRVDSNILECLSTISKMMHLSEKKQ